MGEELVVRYVNQKIHTELLIREAARNIEPEEIREHLEEAGEEFSQFDLEDIRNMIGRARITVQIPLEGL